MNLNRNNLSNSLIMLFSFIVVYSIFFTTVSLSGASCSPICPTGQICSSGACVDSGCILSSAWMVPNCAGGNSPDCEAGETVTMYGSFTNGCQVATHFQMDAKSSDGLCDVQYNGGSMRGIYSWPFFSGSFILAGTWTIPAISPTCIGKTVSMFSASLYTVPPGTISPISNIVNPPEASGSLVFSDGSDTMPPIVTGYSPSGDISYDTVRLEVTTSENGYCQYSTSDFVYGQGNQMFDIGTYHSSYLDVLSEGQHTYYVRCSDIFNNIMQSSAVINFDILSIPPTWSNMWSSVANNTAVNTGTKINISAQWNDNAALSMYTESVKTNNGGSWENSSWNAFTSGNWSNFTVEFPSQQDSKITVKIYANDSSNNQNVTGVWFWYNIATTSDTTSPAYSSNSTNSTYAGNLTEFRLYWTDNVALSGYIFSFDNCTGTLTNDTFVRMTGPANWSNVAKTVSSTVGCTIRWKVYANDTSNNWNASQTYSYTTCQSGTCIPVTQYKLLVDTFADITSAPVQSVPVTVDGSAVGTTNSSGMLEVQLIPGMHTVSVGSVSTRTFTHFWDSDCSSTNNGYYLDTPSNPYSFNITNKNRMITAFYTAFTNITGLNYNGTQISGKLLDEAGNSLRQVGGYHPVCENNISNINNKTINRNVTLDYSADGGTTWTGIATIDSLADGNWSYPFSCPSSLNRIRASYTPTPTNWYFNFSSATMIISSCGTCVPATCSSLGKSCGSWPDGCGGTVDCGSCGGGDGGGIGGSFGGGGGTIITPAKNTTTNGTQSTSQATGPTTICVPSWSCGDWSACVNGTQMRTCTDANNCGTTTNMPDLSGACIVQTTAPTGLFLGLSTANWIIGILVGIAVGLFVIYGEKNLKKIKKVRLIISQQTGWK